MARPWTQIGKKSALQNMVLNLLLKVQYKNGKAGVEQVLETSTFMVGGFL